jgi:hypothetical protein
MTPCEAGRTNPRTLDRPLLLPEPEPLTETNDGSAQFLQKKQKPHPGRPGRVSSLPSVRDFDQRV